MRNFHIDFQTYPFEKLNKLLEQTTSNKDYKEAILTIGEPSFETPMFIQEALKNSSDTLKKYPKSSGENELIDALLGFVKRRFKVTLKNSELIPTLGTREVLFNFPQFLSFNIKNPFFAFTNPFYQIYEGAAICSRAKVKYINLNKQNDFLPSLDDETLEKLDFVVLNFPNNPTSKSLSMENLIKWVKLGLKYDFILMNDECYSEIYFDTPPPSLLEASLKAGNLEFKNILVVNSLSKRSSAPGLRSGFIAGDKMILQAYKKYRTYLGTNIPNPLQMASAVAWSDEKHVEENREKYRKNFELAKDILGIKIPKSTFYIWLEVDDDLEFTKTLYREKNIKVLPGSFLSRGEFKSKHVRIALVENEEKTKEALLRIKDVK
jgi:aspartate/methionine/tyrosine aminotransferase